VELGRSEEPAPPLARRIRAARDLRGLGQADVVGNLRNPISTSALSQIESGKVRPSRQTLQDLAVALDVPVEFFSAQWPSEDSPVTFFRDLRATSAKERRRAAALAMLVSDLVAAIEMHARLPEVRLPNHELGPDASRGQIEDAARQVRMEWQLGTSEPIPHVVRELERHGVVVARLIMGHQSVDAFSVRFSRRPVVLLTEDKSNYVRSRFDAAHELAHLVAHVGAETGSRLVERQAHDFASSFLMPKPIALTELPRQLDPLGWSKLAELKSHWGISIGALLYRARDLKILNDDTYRNAMKFMSARGWRTVEPGDREMGPPEAPLLIERALKRIEVEGGPSTAELVRWAHLPQEDALQLIRAAGDRRPIVEL
jgi:Zn-dependent peptidase ImmA (M78 family)